MERFFASISHNELFRDTFELLGLEHQALVLTDNNLRITAATSGAESILGTCVLRPLAQLLSKTVAQALHECISSQTDAWLSETIDNVTYHIYARANSHGLLLRLEHAFDMYRTALDHFQTRRIRDALSSVLMASQRLSRVTDQEQIKLLSNIMRHHSLAIERMLLHADMLTAPPDAVLPDLKEEDLAILCHWLVSQFRLQCNTQIQIETDLPRSCPAVFDKKQMTQAICNLFTNAIAAPDVTTITITLTRAQGQILLSICDDGRGLPDDRTLGYLYHAWRTPQTADSATATDKPSWGLGLPLVHHIMSLHAGMLLWRPNIPHGCIFTMCLPEQIQAPYCLGQPSLQIHDGLHIADVELSVL